tara:strand:+ start:146 stop:406 length:261 start_codon:yes stop_codon:yes gene_type:complete
MVKFPESEIGPTGFDAVRVAVERTIDATINIKDTADRLAILGFVVEKISRSVGLRAIDVAGVHQLFLHETLSEIMEAGRTGTGKLI